MGWTTVNEAAVPILTAKHTHEELRDRPIVDKTCCVLMANNEILLDRFEDGGLGRWRNGAALNALAPTEYDAQNVIPSAHSHRYFGTSSSALYSSISSTHTH